jgi:hypothetical protein
MQFPEHVHELKPEHYDAARVTVAAISTPHTVTSNPIVISGSYITGPVIHNE